MINISDSGNGRLGNLEQPSHRRQWENMVKAHFKVYWSANQIGELPGQYSWEDRGCGHGDIFFLEIVAWFSVEGEVYERLGSQLVGAVIRLMQTQKMTKQRVNTVTKSYKRRGGGWPGGHLTQAGVKVGILLKLKFLLVSFLPLCPHSLP